MMDKDSPMGEMKREALTVWRAMRLRGVIPTQEGYISLLKVYLGLIDLLMVRWLPKLETY